MGEPYQASWRWRLWPPIPASFRADHDAGLELNGVFGPLRGMRCGIQDVDVCVKNSSVQPGVVQSNDPAILSPEVNLGHRAEYSESFFVPAGATVCTWSERLIYRGPCLMGTPSFTAESLIQPFFEH